MELITRHLDRSLTAAEATRLSAWIKADSANAQRFVREAIVHSHIRDLLVGQQALLGPMRGNALVDSSDTMIVRAISPEDVPEEFEPARAPERPAPRPVAGKLHIWGRRAAVVLLPLVLAGVLYGFLRPRPAVATLTGVVEAKWDAPHDSLHPGQSLPSGELYLKSGLAEIRLKSGVSVILQAPARFQVDSDNAIDLKLGKLTAVVPAVAQGFSVQTATGRVVDLGTEFGVSVSKIGATALEVFRGTVRAEPGTSGAAGAMTLVAGQAAKVSAAVVALEPPDAIREEFVRSLKSPPATTPAPATQPVIVVAKAPAPLFDDPVWHGAASPTVIWNESRGEWLMYYTQRRATLDSPDGVKWVYGSAIGIATSKDGLAWKYLQTCSGDESLGDPIGSNSTWWHPSICFEGGIYHMFVARVDGIYSTWIGPSTIKHFTSQDGLTWKSGLEPELPEEVCLDPCIVRIGTKFGLYFSDNGNDGHTRMATSDDLDHWSVVEDDEAVGDVSHKSPLVWHWKDRYWMSVDVSEGLRIYESADGLKDWKYNATVLSEPGKRGKDDGPGQGAFVVVQGDQAILYYFVRYGPAHPVYDTRRSVIQIAELQLNPEGQVTCDRNGHGVR
jgi:hypothetical protein